MSQCVFTQLPILDKLSKASPTVRRKLLKAANTRLIRSIVECIHNVMKGNLRLERACMEKLRKYKNTLRSLNKVGQKFKEKKRIIIQTGGSFLPALLSPIIGILINKIFEEA